MITKSDIESLGWIPYVFHNVWRIYTPDCKWFLRLQEDGVWIQRMLTDYGIDVYQGPCETLDDLKVLMESHHINQALN